MSYRKPQRVLAPLIFAVAVTAGLGGCAGSLDRAQQSLSVGDQEEAEVHLRKALKQSSTQKEAARLLSILLAKKGEAVSGKDPLAAEGMFREALELDETNEVARLDFARLLMKRGSDEDASKLLAREDCKTCGRLIAIMLHEEAVQLLAAGDIGGARKSFQEAFEIGKDPIDALGLARTYLVDELPDLVKARELLEAAAPRITRGQTEAENEFSQLRTLLLLAAAANKQDDLVVAVFAIRSEALADEPEFDLRFKVAQEQFRSGNSDPAIASLNSLLENSGQYLEPTQRQVMSAAMVVMYSARAAQHLGAGDAAGAAKDIAAARKIDGDNNRLKLQQVLAIAANGRLELAFDTLAKDATKGKDTDQVRAILYAMQVYAHVEANSLSAAESSLAEAEALGLDLPEVRLARAYVLSLTRNDDLKKKEIPEARKQSGFEYPGGVIMRYAGALAHVDRARDRVAEQGVLHPFRGANFDSRVTELDAKLRAIYPHDVQWFSAEGGMIELVAEAGQKDVAYTGPRWLKGTAIASPGKSAEIPVPSPGMVTLDVDGKPLIVVVDANAHIKVKL